MLNHKRFIARIRAGKGEFNNDDHHDSHEFVSWLIDEIHMNICEDYRHLIKKKLMSKDYQKERLNIIKKMEEAGVYNSAVSKDKLADYSSMSSEDLDSVLAQKLLPSFRTWVQLMFEGELCTITKCQSCEYLSIR